MSKAVANLTQSTETITFSAQDNGETISVNITEAARGPAGAAGAAGPNSVTSATTSDGTANLSLSNVTTATAEVTGTLTADHIHGNLAGSVYAHVRAGENLAKGDPVYVSGSHGTGANLIAIVSKADASDPLKMPAIGVMDAAVTANANGHMVITGTISDINTATYSVNAELYVAEGGGFTATPPNAYAQPVARVERSNTNNGAVIVKVNGLSAYSNTGNTLVRRSAVGDATFSALQFPSEGIGTTELGVNNDGSLESSPSIVLPGASGTLALTDNFSGVVGIAYGGTNATTVSDARANLSLGPSGTITTSQPLSLTQTWNAGAVTFKGIDVNITDTSSASGSLLMDLRVGGNPYFSIEKDGSTRLYRTYSSSTNFERLNLKYTGTAFQIGTEKGSAGGTARSLEFQTDGTTRMTIAANGVLSTTTHATFAGYVSPTHLRLTGGTGEAKLYKGTGDGSFAFYNQAETSRCIINIATDGVLKVRNIGNTDYAVADAQHRLQGTAPASAAATGTAGDIRYDADYIYICTATNTWKRAAIATWP